MEKLTFFGFVTVVVVACILHSDAQVTCPPGQEHTPCFENPCNTESCPSFPNATCTADYCGGCNAVFTNSDGEVIPKFTCSITDNYPKCLEAIRCGNIQFQCETKCPLVPSAVCNLYCDCDVIFTDIRTGNGLSDNDCLPSPPSCPPNQPISKCSFPLSCDREKCSRYPNAICRNNNCRGCNAAFLDKNGDVIPKFSCSLKSNWPQCLDSISCPGIGSRCKDECPGIPDVRCFRDCNCNLIFTDGVNGNQLTTQQCLPNCSFPIITCLVDPCQFATCRGVPGATCRIGLCGECTATFFDRNGEKLTSEQCDAPVTCPPTKPKFNCTSDPCNLAQCPEVPEAKCFTDPCGGCSARFITRSGLIPSEGTCSENCPLDKPVSRCVRPLPCETETCPRFETANCSNSFCGGCNAIFTDSKGVIVPKFACPAKSKWPVCLISTTCLDPTLSCALDCPGVPDARCLQDCNCDVIFTDKDNGNTLTQKQCKPQCGGKVPNCLVAPCQFDKCPGVPGAICRGGICGECLSSFYYPNGTIITGEQCHAPVTCPADKPRSECKTEPCSVSKCPGVPLARCENDYCGGCFAVFTSANGLKVSAENCNPELFCSPLFDPDNEEDLDFLINCSKGNSIGSICTLSCPPGKILQGGISQLICGSKNMWNGSIDKAKCVKKGPPCPLIILDSYKTSFGLSCSNGRKIGSVCNVTCSKRRFLIGTSQIKCLSDSTWDLDKTLSSGITQCIPKTVCSRRSPPVSCNQSVCDEAKCQRHPKAHCVVNSCGKCSYRFYQYGHRLSKQECIPPPCPRIEVDLQKVSFWLSCSNGRRTGSVCNVTCSKHQFLFGTSQIKCLPDSTWDLDKTLSSGITQCIPKTVCPRGSPPVSCNQSACDQARCPKYSKAHCVENSCGKCSFNYYLYGKHLTREKCIRKQKCPIFTTFLRINCRKLKKCQKHYCADHPKAVCAIDCYCNLKFYDSTTLEKISCKKVRRRPCLTWCWKK